MSNEKLVIHVWYGDKNRILRLESVNLNPYKASDLAKTIEILVLGYQEIDKFEKPENIVERFPELGVTPAAPPPQPGPEGGE